MVEVMRHCTNFSLIAADHVQHDHEGEDSQQSLVLVVLNYDLPSFTPALWQQVRLRICADGGANRLFDELPKFLPHENKESVRLRYKPDVINGDLDSLRPEVREFYSNLGTTVVDQSYDQDTTDLEKCITFVRNSTSDLEAVKLKFLVVGALGGRFDHVAAHINVLYKFLSLRIILLSDESLLYLLPKGFSHEILLNTTFEGPHCGLIPFGTTSESTTTTGLHWNLNNTKMAFGSLDLITKFIDLAENNFLRGPSGIKQELLEQTWCGPYNCPFLNDPSRHFELGCNHFCLGNISKGLKPAAE